MLLTMHDACFPWENLATPYVACARYGLTLAVVFRVHYDVMFRTYSFEIDYAYLFARYAERTGIVFSLSVCV